MAEAIYGQDAQVAILAKIAEGQSLRKACNGEHLPSPTTVCRWANEDPDFAKRYAQARAVGYALLADGLLEIADDGSNDTYTDEEGRTKVDIDVIARSRLRVDTRKWLLSKMLPKVYGERVAVEASGPNGGPIEVSIDEVRNRLIGRISGVASRIGTNGAHPGTNGNGAHSP